MPQLAGPMALHIELRQPSRVPIEVEGITPDRVRQMALGDIERLEIFHGNCRVPLAELFTVAGDPQDGQMIWQGELAGVHWIGAKMASGRIHVTGSCGRHLGSEMTGGEILVDGDAGDWVGGEMHGGLIHVRGRAGHLVGAAYRGSRVGMTGGTILIGGDAGNEIGHTMRRGLIAIGGSIGDLAGFNMRAGSLLVFGGAGIRHGAGMRRGTLVFFGTSPELLPTFRRACRYRPDIMRLMLRYVQQQSMNVDLQLADAPFELYNGDMLEGGRGEVLVRAG